MAETRYRRGSLALAVMSAVSAVLCGESYHVVPKDQGVNFGAGFFLFAAIGFSIAALIYPAMRRWNE
jgi:hypothetical protein